MSTGVDHAVDRAKQRHFVLAASMIVVLALLSRIVYVLMVQVDFPIVGDVNQYVLYAWNLVHRGVFSTALPQAATAMPDSYRGPGYSLWLAAMMQLAGHSDLPLRPAPHGLHALGYASDTWMRYAIASQVALGTATVLLTILTARLWLNRSLALCAGAFAALWPHMITFTGVLLSETVFGFFLLLSIWLACHAERRRDGRLAAFAGLGFGFAYLVNPVVAFFPPMLALAVWLRSKRREAIVLLAVFAIAPCVWTVHGMRVGSGSAGTRAAQNIVQGSIPQFLRALNSRSSNTISAQIVALADDETRLLIASPTAGLKEISERMSEDPAFYAEWYLFRKPFLLWDWNIQVGWGDIYFPVTKHSPFERIPALRISKQAIQWANPAIFALAAFAAFWFFLRFPLRYRDMDFPPFAIALFVLYITAVHDVFQAEPRYSIPYRPEEIVLAMATIAIVLQLKIWRRDRRIATMATQPSQARKAEALTP